MMTGTSRSRRRRPLIAILLLLALAALGTYAGLLARDVWADATTGRAALDRGVATLTAQPASDLTVARLDAAARDFRLATASFAHARLRLGLWADLAATHRDLLPGPAAQLRSVAPLLDLARASSAMALSLSQGARPLLAALDGPAVPAQVPSPGAWRTGGALARLLAGMDAADPALARAQDQLQAARALRARLAGLPAIASAAPLLATFDRRVRQLAAALAYLRAAPSPLGGHGARAYLLVYQDTADLRATGGFIGAAGLLLLDHGRLSQIDYETTGSQPGPLNLQLPDSRTGPPPAPLFYYRGLGSFQLRDANFWPDFPTSARHIADLYRRATGRTLDGVVAVNPAAIATLLGALGPLAVPGYGEPVTAATVIGRIEYYTHDRPGAHGDPHRKRFVVALNHALTQRLLAVDSTHLAGVLLAMQSALADRSVLVSLNDPVFAPALRRAHWDGAIRDEPGDYLAVFDQNVTDSKLNPFVDQQITYDATRLADGGLDATLTITYHNGTHANTFWIGRTYYQDYLRIGLPAGSHLRDQAGYDDTFWPDEAEAGRLLIAGGLVVPQAGTRTISLRYSVPPGALANTAGYRLLVQKQPGSRPAQLTVRIHAGATTWTAQAWLRHDLSLSIRWNAPSGTFQFQ